MRVVTRGSIRLGLPLKRIRRIAGYQRHRSVTWVGVTRTAPSRASAPNRFVRGWLDRNPNASALLADPAVADLMRQQINSADLVHVTPTDTLPEALRHQLSQIGAREVLVERPGHVSWLNSGIYMLEDMDLEVMAADCEDERAASIAATAIPARNARIPVLIF